MNIHASKITDEDRRAIRTLWLADHRESYPAQFLAELFRLSAEKVVDLAGGSLELTASGEIKRSDALMIAAIYLFSPAQIEDALGSYASTVLPQSRRTCVVTLRLSTWLIEGITRLTTAPEVVPLSRDRSVDMIASEALDEYLTQEFRGRRFLHPPVDYEVRRRHVQAPRRRHVERGRRKAG